MFDVRPVQPKDIFSVIKITADTLPEHYCPELFNQFYETFPEGFFVAEVLHKIVGFIVGYKTSADTARITLLSVRKDYRNKGIGSALITHFLQKIAYHHINCVELEVRVSNTTAITFYQKHGFVITETIKRFYQTGEDACIMRRWL